jgi:hypothetical protein
MFSQDRTAMRGVFLEAWRRFQGGEPLEPLHLQIVEVAKRHPEYHPLLQAGEPALAQDWLPHHGEANPFLHMALHLAVQDQVTTDGPRGMRQLYGRIVRDCLGDTHEAEHRIMECLGEAMWRMQRDARDLDEKAYLKCIKKHGGGRRGPN